MRRQAGMSLRAVGPGKIVGGGFELFSAGQRREFAGVASSAPVVTSDWAPAWPRLAALTALACALAALIAVTLAPARGSVATIASGGARPVPVSASALLSDTLGGGLSTYWIARSGGVLRARDPRAGLRFRFGRGAVVASGAAGTLRLGLLAVGGDSGLRSLGSERPSADRNRAVYRYGGGIAEWFANGPLGLEQGFTLRHRVAGRVDGGPLSLGLSLGARGWRPVLAPGGRSVELVRAGRVVLRYGDLSARDATGRRLRSWFQLTRGRLVVHVDDAEARYPLTIDPLLQSGELVASDPSAAPGFGGSIAVSGNTLVAGVPDATVNGNADQGAVYVFTEPPSGWGDATETAILTASNGLAGADLGASVAVSDNTIVASGSGSAYVFVAPPAGWATGTQTAELTASGGATADAIESVAISDDTIVGGAPAAASVFLFAKPEPGWTSGVQTATFTASAGSATEDLGYAVAISGGTVAASVYISPSARGNTGEVYLFIEPTSGGWVSETQTATLTASDSGNNDFGFSLAVSSGTVAIGAPAWLNSTLRTGAVYVFAEGPSGWISASQTAILTASDGATADELGSSVAVSGDTILSGAPEAKVNGITDQGAAYMFVEPASGWGTGTETAKLTASDSGSDGLGMSVGLSADTAFVGAPSASPSALYEFGLAPVPSAGSVSGISPVAAMVSGSVDPRGTTVSDCHFDFGLTSAYGTSVPCAGVIGTSGPTTVSAQLTGLTPGTTYHYRVVATNQYGTAGSADATFTTTPPPAVTSASITHLSRTGALLAGTVNPEGIALTDCHFDYGPTAVYGKVLPCPELPGATSSAVMETARVTGLTPGRTYHYRLVATSAAGTGYAPDGSFTTLLGAVVETGGARRLSSSGATLSGTVNPEGQTTSACYFDYGPTKHYGSRASCRKRAVSGHSPVSVSAAVTGLAPATRYHYRLVATTGAGTSDGSDRTLKTGPAPFVGAVVPPPLFSPGPTATKVVRLLVVGVSSGVRIRIICHGGGCPYAAHTITDRPACSGKRCERATITIALTSEFAGAGLSAGTVLTILITKPGRIGNYYAYTMHAGQLPTVRSACLPPGQTRPGSC